MSEIKLLAIAILLYGAANLAEATTTPSDGLGYYKSQIHTRVDSLNAAVPDLNLRPRSEPLNTAAAFQMLSDVQHLENALSGREVVPDHSLTTLVCARALCFNED